MPVAGLSTNQWSRTARLAGLPAEAAGRSAAGLLRRLAGHDPEAIALTVATRNAERTAAVLGDLKGVALKAGQFLSTIDAMLYDPESPWRTAFASLDEDTQGLPFREVEPVLIDELGPDWHHQLRRLDPAPAAAASLGQVHMAEYDGRLVAVKIQYPGVREAVRADLRMLSAGVRAMRMTRRGRLLRPLVGELRRRLLEELDYIREGESQDRYAYAFAGDPDTAVPGVHLATPRVLVTDWMDGTPLVHVAASGSQEDRDRLGERYQRFLLCGPSRTGLLHADPHPGNFRLLPDGRLGVLDFGAVQALPGGWPRSFGRLISIVLRGSAEGILDGLREERFLRPGIDLDPADLAAFLSPFAEPADMEVFHFRPEWLRSVFGRSAGREERELSVLDALTLPSEQLLTQRVWISGVGVLCQLRARVGVRDELLRWLPGFVPA